MGKDNLNQVDVIQETPNAPMTAVPTPVDPSGTPAPVSSGVTAAKQQNGGANLESIGENNAENKTMTNTPNTDNEGTDNEGSTKGGLTSEERVLLREKKKARLQKEQADQLSQETCQNNQELNFGGQKGDEGHSESGAEGSATEGDEGTEGGSARGRLTRSGRRKGLGKLDDVVDKLQDGTNETGTEANEDSS